MLVQNVDIWGGWVFVVNKVEWKLLVFSGQIFYIIKPTQEKYGMQLKFLNVDPLYKHCNNVFPNQSGIEIENCYIT